jgi:hypothetical protein
VSASGRIDSSEILLWRVSLTHRKCYSLFDDDQQESDEG